MNGGVDVMEDTGKVFPNLEALEELDKLYQAYKRAFLKNFKDYPDMNEQAFSNLIGAQISNFSKLKNSQPYSDLQLAHQTFKNDWIKYLKNHDTYEKLKLEFGANAKKTKDAIKELKASKHRVIESRLKLDSYNEAFCELTMQISAVSQSVFGNKRLFIKKFANTKLYYYNGEKIDDISIAKKIIEEKHEQRELHTTSLPDEMDNITDPFQNTVKGEGTPEVDPSKPEEVDRIKPEVDSINPEEVDPSKPEEVDSINPEEVDSIKPEEVDPSKLEEVYPIKPEPEDPSKPTANTKKSVIRGFRNALVENAGQLLNFYGTASSIIDVLDEKDNMNSALTYLDRNSYRTNMIVNSSIAAVETALFGAEAALVYSGLAAAAFIGMFGMALGIFALPVPILLDKRAQKLSSAEDIALYNHDLYSRTEAVKAKFVTEVVIPDYFEQGILAFEQKDTSFTIEKIDLTNGQVKFEVKNSLYFADNRQSKFYSAEEVLAKAFLEQPEQFPQKTRRFRNPCAKR